MTELVFILIAINLPFMMLFGVPGYFIRRQRRKIRKELFVLKTMGRVAKLRADLFDLAARRKMDSETASFRVFYQLHTTLVRHPDHFDVTASAVIAAFSQEYSALSPETGRILAEQKQWPKEMIFIVGETADVLSDMAHWRFLEVVADNKVKFACHVADFTRKTVWKYASDGTKALIKKTAGSLLSRSVSKGMTKDPVSAQLRAASFCVAALVAP